MANTDTKILIHLVFSTKKRECTISPRIRARLFPFIGGIARGKGVTAIQVGGIQDHVHMLLGMPTTISVAEAAKTIKGVSSRWIHEEFPNCGFTSWQEGYGAFSIGASQIDRTVAYILGQEEHHRRETFQDEFLRFLAANQVEFDPRYIWD